MGHPFRFGVIISDKPGQLSWPERVRAIAAGGYGALLMTDHLSGQFAPGPALAAAAAVAPQLRVGTLVYCNDLYRPAVLAREVATLAHLTNGRFEFGLGAGWHAADYARAGVPWQPAGVRIERLGESLDIVEGCLRADSFTYRGRHHDVEIDQPVVPALRPADRPSVIIGGGGPRVLRLAGRRADIVSINLALTDPEDNSSTFYSRNDAAATDRKVGWVRDGAGERFDSIELAMTIYLTVVCDDRDAVARMLARRAGVEYPQLLENPHVLVGTPEQIVDTLCRRRDRWGISYFMVDEWQHKTLGGVVEKLSGR